MTIATSATPPRHADLLPPHRSQSMRPGSLDTSFETRHRARRPFVIITTDIESTPICQRSSAAASPTTAAGHEPSRASQVCETADPTQLRLEGRHATTSRVRSRNRTTTEVQIVSNHVKVPPGFIS